MKLVFNEDGVLLGTGDDCYNQYQSDPTKRFADSLSGKNELWRYTYDIENDALVCAYPTLSDEDALAQLLADQTAEDAE
jgi:hypothetical protein